ncbi:cytochrome b/b6 domain-containing protein [Marinobacterium weihaiense]|uniref:Cytochrome b/b6 domain-containing protein n=1 Tax=Marinobacterium weihaiense TaxID=2851016 RepID=A0ABS6MCT9_9GAMM|nr:cytochrome b/b6 domain-containing protein [Marinobacterium weihaiense]MBV0934116.1 cytochrome b/b6 domain-containing protein [Marinobacterium weihaiense]
MTRQPVTVESKPVWDIFVRLFHWSLAASILFAWWSGEQGGNWMEWHMYAGYSVLGLVLFRLMWGFAGSHYARFAEFVRSPVHTLRYGLKLARHEEPHYTGHNPLGGWMVLALLLLSAAQAGTGLFANDEIFTEGPLVHLVSYDLSVEITRWHKLIFDGLLIAIGLHLLGVLVHQVFKREKLIQAMLHGRKPVGISEETHAYAPLVRGLVLALVAAAVIWAMLNLL